MHMQGHLRKKLRLFASVARRGGRYEYDSWGSPIGRSLAVETEEEIYQDHL